MGKATIISEYGEGQYRIQPVIDTTRSAAEIVRIQAENTAIDARLAELVAEISSTESDLDFAMQALNAAIINKDDLAHIKSVQEEVLALQLALQSLISSREYLTLRKTSNEKRIAWLQQEIAHPAALAAWCADHTEELTGTVGTIEIGRNPTTPIIRPGTLSAYSASRDGQLQPLASSSPAAVFYNAAMQPGVAKWMPRYRTGIASNVDIDTDTMTVTLDAETIAGLNVNQAVTLSAVPVVYMICNAVAFTAGDHVVVEFPGQDWSAPQVIGFVDNPEPCEVPGGITCYNPSDIYGAELSQVLSVDPNWIATALTVQPYGTIEWTDGIDRVAWQVKGGRYSNTGGLDENIYINGILALRVGVGVQVLGAALMRVADDVYCNIWARFSSYQVIAYQKLWAGVPDLATNDWTSLQQYTVPDYDPAVDVFPWHFNAAGTESSTVFGVTRGYNFATLVSSVFSVGAVVVTDEGIEPPGGHGSIVGSRIIDVNYDPPGTVVTVTENSSGTYRALLFVDYLGATRVIGYLENVILTSEDATATGEVGLTYSQSASVITTFKTTLGVSKEYGENIRSRTVTLTTGDDGQTINETITNSLVQAHLLAADIRYGLIAVFNYAATSTDTSSGTSALVSAPVDYTVVGSIINQVMVDTTSVLETSAPVNLSGTRNVDTWSYPYNLFTQITGYTADQYTVTDQSVPDYQWNEQLDAASGTYIGGLAALSPADYLFAQEISMYDIAGDHVLHLSRSGNTSALLGISDSSADKPSIIFLGVV